MIGFDSSKVPLNSYRIFNKKVSAYSEETTVAPGMIIVEHYQAGTCDHE